MAAAPDTAPAAADQSGLGSRYRTRKPFKIWVVCSETPAWVLALVDMLGPIPFMVQATMVSSLALVFPRELVLERHPFRERPTQSSRLSQGRQLDLSRTPSPAVGRIRRSFQLPTGLEVPPRLRRVLSDRKSWRILEQLLGMGGAAIWCVSVLLSFWFWHSMPTSPNEEGGFVIPMINHGRTVYLTATFEYLYEACFWGGMLMFFSAAVIDLHKNPFGWQRTRK